MPTRRKGDRCLAPGTRALQKLLVIEPARVLDKGADPFAEINPRVTPKSADLDGATRHPTYRFRGEFQSAEFWHTTGMGMAGCRAQAF